MAGKNRDTEYISMNLDEYADCLAAKAQAQAEREASIFNWSLYRALMKDRRQKLGYRDARMFARTIYLRTRVEIAADSYYKIESGRQGIKAEQFMALNIALWGNPWPQQIMNLCTGREWGEIAAAEYPSVPRLWEIENMVEDGIDEENFTRDFVSLIVEGKAQKEDAPLYGQASWAAEPED